MKNKFVTAFVFILFLQVCCINGMTSQQPCDKASKLRQLQEENAELHQSLGRRLEDKRRIFSELQDQEKKVELVLAEKKRECCMLPVCGLGACTGCALCTYGCAATIVTSAVFGAGAVLVMAFMAIVGK